MTKFLIIFSVLSCLNGWCQTEIELPPIEGEEGASVAPKGWSVLSNSPDIISGNGLWLPNFGQWGVRDIRGDTTTTGNMGFFVALPTGYIEGWKTTLTDLNPGEEYSISLQWQQCTYFLDTVDHYAGGALLIKAGEAEQLYTHLTYQDDWHTAIFTFIATEKTMELQISIAIPETGCILPGGCAIVVDNLCAKCREAARP